MGDNSAIKAALDALQNAMIKRNTAIDAHNAEDALNEDAEWAAFAALEAALNGGGAPTLPVVSIKDAEPVKAGEKLQFPVTLSELVPDGVQLTWTLGGNAATLVSAAALTWSSPLAGDLRIETKADAPGLPTDLHVALQPAPDFTLGQATAVGRVLPAVVPPVDGGDQEGLEAVDPSSLQVTLIAENRGRHVFRGRGYGLNAAAPAQEMIGRFRQFAEARLSRKAIGTNVIRILNPTNPATALGAFKPYVDHLREIGSEPEWIVGTGFVWRAASTVTALIDGVAECRRGGLPINVLVAQNEPDGNPSNAIAGGPSKYVQYVEEALARLRHHKLESEVEFAGLGEWRHPTAGGLQEARILRDAGLIGKGKVAQGALHIYDKGPDLELAGIYGDLGIGSWETGNNGWPSMAGRELSGINLASIFELTHYCIIATPTPNSEQLGQALIDYHGKPRPWWGWDHISRELTPGSVIRRVSSSDRPGLPTDMAQWMLRHAPRGGGYQPRQNAVFARRGDGSYVLLAVNTTHGSDGPNPYTSGHYGARKQQITFRADELIGKSGNFTAYRTIGDGSFSGPQTYPMVDGRLRFKLEPAEAIVLLGKPT